MGRGLTLLMATALAGALAIPFEVGFVIIGTKLRACGGRGSRRIGPVG
jgi:hypothetical protein